MRRNFNIVVIIVFFGLGLLSTKYSQTIMAQTNASATPLRVVIPTSTVPSTQLAIATPTSTPTPTEEGPIMLSLRPEAESANMRAEPDPGAEQLGIIEPGETYRVLGQYFSWIQFETDTSPNGRAWVYGELVELSGDTNEIPVIDPFADPTDLPEVLEATLTWEAVTLTPGGILTATAQSRIIAVPTSLGDAQSGLDSETGNAPLPTFTYPPDLVAQAPTEVGMSTAATATSEPTDALADAIAVANAASIPPIAYILTLGAVGILGLVIISLRK